jgi:PAS domain S-box-containing protein
MVFRAEEGAESTMRVSAAPLDPAGEQAGAVAVFHDVTAIRRADAKFRGLLEAAPDALVGVGADGRIVLVNAAAERLFGYDRHELLGAEVELLVPTAAHALHREHRAGYVAGPHAGPMSPRGTGLDGQLRARRRDGTEFPVEVTLSTLEGGGGRDSAGEHGGTLVVAAIRDSTARLQQQQALEDVNGRLEVRVAERTSQLEEQAELLRATNAELEAFSSSVSHDLRAPLRTVAGFARIVEQDYRDVLDETGRRHLAKVREGTIRMGTMIDGLLTFSRLQRRSLNVRRVRLGPLVEEVWDDLAAEREGRTVELTMDALPDGDADPRLLRHVLGNLLSNAIKYTRDRDEARVHVSSHRDEYGVPVYSVADNGVGFDPDYAGKLFEIFQRLHREEEYEGTGVGLALAARIVHRHGGRIWADSVPGAGATFSFTLAVAPGREGAAVDLDRAAGAASLATTRP